MLLSATVAVTRLRPMRVTLIQPRLSYVLRIGLPAPLSKAASGLISVRGVINGNLRLQQTISRLDVIFG
jgi:hypothetical protein